MEEKWKKKKKKKVKKKKVKYRRRSLWKKCKERVERFLTADRKEEDVEKKARKSDRRPRARQALAKSGRWLFLFLLFWQNWLCVDAAAEGLQKRTEMMKRMRHQEVVEEVSSTKQSTWRQEPEREAEVPKIIVVSDAVRGTMVDLDGKGLQVKQVEKIPRKWKRPNGAGWTERRKEEKRLKCTLLNGPAWSTEKK